MVLSIPYAEGLQEGQSFLDILKSSFRNSTWSTTAHVGVQSQFRVLSYSNPNFRCLDLRACKY